MSSYHRRFLLLQGPHGPFFWRLGQMLRTAGADVWRVGFNAGDRAFWRDRDSFIPFNAPQSQWPDRFGEICAEHAITDLVLYGDTRPIHAQAIAKARALGLRVHVFEEGYLRPFWVTYERGGSNGNSRLMDMTVDEMRADLDRATFDPVEAPAHWGDMRQHVFYGALYHWFVMFRNHAFTHFKRHRELSVHQEFRSYLKRLILMPQHRLARMIATRRIKRGGYPYHIALLQLAHDSSFIFHSPFTEMRDFIDLVIAGFAEGAPKHHHLVFKAHPLEPERGDTRAGIAAIAKAYGVADRVHYVRGGKLGQLLDHARSAVTINSTAAQQCLWRGLPVKVFGDAVYAKPEFVSQQDLPTFFAHPARPDTDAYRDYRQYLLETSQVPGGFYSVRGRRQLLRLVVDMMLDKADPYDALADGTAAPRPSLSVVG